MAQPFEKDTMEVQKQQVTTQVLRSVYYTPGLPTVTLSKRYFAYHE